MNKWIILLFSCAFVFSANAQIPLLPDIFDFLKPAQNEYGVLNETRVVLEGNNYTILQQDIRARSRGFKILGLISIRSPSYTEAMSRLYAKAGVKEGHPQALANIVHERSSGNFLLFSIPKIRVRADLIEFMSDEGLEQGGNGSAMPTLLRSQHRGKLGRAEDR